MIEDTPVLDAITASVLLGFHAVIDVRIIESYVHLVIRTDQYRCRVNPEQAAAWLFKLVFAWTSPQVMRTRMSATPTDTIFVTNNGTMVTVRESACGIMLRHVDFERLKQ